MHRHDTEDGERVQRRPEPFLDLEVVIALFAASIASVALGLWVFPPSWRNDAMLGAALFALIAALGLWRQLYSRRLARGQNG